MHCTTTGAHKDTQPQKPCCKVVAIAHSSSIQQLLCSRFGAMWDGNLREATKLRTCNSKWDQNSTSSQEYDSKVQPGNWAHGVSANVALADSACSRWLERPCTRLIVLTGQLKWTRGGCALVTSRGMPKIVNFGHGTAWYLVPDFHTFTSKNCTSLSLGHSAMM